MFVSITAQFRFDLQRIVFKVKLSVNSGPDWKAHIRAPAFQWVKAKSRGVHSQERPSEKYWGMLREYGSIIKAHI